MATDARDRESERRQVTVVFADISGFTAMSEKLDPEDVTAVMNGCFTLMEEIVHAHGGTVDKYIGDCVMALFGAPKAIENGPAQAVNAAIEMRNRLDDFNRTRRLVVPLRTHVGVNTGLVLAGQVGGETTRDFTVMGDTVNLASRLKDKAPNGEIWIGPGTYQAVREQFQLRKLKPLALKGKEQPVDAWAVESATEQLHRPRPSTSERMVFSPLVGRRRELELLGAALARVRDGQGAIASVVAEAGLGKSRLVAEVVESGALRDVTFLEGRAVAMGSGLSFHPFVDLLRHWAGIADADDERESARKLETAITTVLGDAAAETVPFVATLMGMRPQGPHAERLAGIEGEALEKLIFKSVRDLVARMAQAAPLVLAFEDLHWADQSSIALLESLLRTVDEVPLAVLCVCRPDHPETSERILAAARAQHAARYTELVLERLDDKQCGELVANLLRIDDLPLSARAAIAHKAEGNPFYIEEVVRSLIDRGVVEHKDGRLRVTGTIEDVIIPGTVQEVIMVRVDRLPETTRRVLQVASVIGRSFYARVLADVLNGDLDLAAELERLKDRQLILERATRQTGVVRRRLLQPEVEYVFKHALAQETIYESILQRTRRELHVKVAASIETVFADRLPDFYAMLAYHYSRAERLEQAEDYLFKAGDEAARAAASNEALNFFREASRLYLVIHGEGGDPARKALLEKNIGLALIARGRLPESVGHFERALMHLGEPVPRGLAVRRRFVLDLLAVLFHLYARRGRPRGRHFAPSDAEILEIRYNKARAQTTSDPQRFFFDTIGTLRRMNQIDPTKIDEACGMYAGTALLFSYSGVSFAIARRLFRVAKGLVRPGNVKDEFVYRHYEWIHHYLEGDWDERHAIEEALIEEDLRRGQLWDVQTYLGLRAEQKIHQGELAEVARLGAKLGEIADVYGLDFARSNQYAMTMWALLQERRLAEASEALDRYYASREEELLNLLALGTRAKLELLRGDREAAVTALRKAEDLLRRDVPVAPYYCTFALTSRAMLDLATLEEAIGRRSGEGGVLAAHAARSMKTLLRCAAKVSWERTEAYKLAGRLAWLAGKQERACDWWRRSLAEGERLGARPELARTHLEIGTRLAEAGSRHRTLADSDAAGHLAKADALFRAVGLGVELEQLAMLRRRAA